MCIYLLWLYIFINNISMIDNTKTQGDALEKNVEFLFQSAGFLTKRNVKIAKYEIDVLALIGDTNIVIECKNYQNSNIVIRNLIHQWNSKNVLIKANKIIIVITGINNIKKTDIELASQFHIELWNEETLNNLFNLSLKPVELERELLKKINLQKISIAEKYRDIINRVITLPYLAYYYFSEKELYTLLNKLLRIFIRSELSEEQQHLTQDESLKYIMLFEGTRDKNIFFKLLKVRRNEKEYWDVVKARLLNESILDKKTQKKYIGYMDELLTEYNSQLSFFKNSAKEDVLKQLIHDRLYLALLEDKNPIFGFNSKNTLKVYPLVDESFKIEMSNTNIKQANFLNWILLSEFIKEEVVLEKESYILYSWICTSLDETVQNIYRILSEYYGFDEYMKLYDYSICSEDFLVYNE